MKIIKLNYSRQPWRLVNSEGAEISWQRPMDHPDLGRTWITETICGNSKTECLERTLEAFELLMNRRNAGA